MEIAVLHIKRFQHVDCIAVLVLVLLERNDAFFCRPVKTVDLLLPRTSFGYTPKVLLRSHARKLTPSPDDCSKSRSRSLTELTR